MSNDAFADDASVDPVYTLIVKAESDREALEAFDANARIATSRFSLRPVSGRPERVLKVEFAFGDGSDWGHDVDAFRVPIERRLNEWLMRDKDECRDGVGFPKGACSGGGEAESRVDRWSAGLPSGEEVLMPYIRVSGSGSTPEGLWVEDHGDWASIAETTDLDSACGEPGYLLDRGAVCPRGSLAEWRTTFEPFGERRRTGVPREVSRAASWSEVWTYGRRDVDESAWASRRRTPGTAWPISGSRSAVTRPAWSSEGGT